MGFKVADDDEHKGVRGGKNARRSRARAGDDVTYGRDQRQCFGNNASTSRAVTAIRQTVAAFDVIGESEAN